jgi:hypothetical protein
MQALSTKMPWAWLMVNHKHRKPNIPIVDVHNFDWAPKVKGRVFVHAGAVVDWQGVHWLRNNHVLAASVQEKLEKICHTWIHGALIGQVDVTECVTSHHSSFFKGPFALVLRNPHAFGKPIYYPGRPGVFDVGEPAEEVKHEDKPAEPQGKPTHRAGQKGARQRPKARSVQKVGRSTPAHKDRNKAAPKTKPRAKPARRRAVRPVPAAARKTAAVRHPTVAAGLAPALRELARSLVAVAKSLESKEAKLGKERADHLPHQ